MIRSEIPKRLSPTRDVSRELFLRSGNICAFPKCKRRIVNLGGKYVGQICHIEGALPTSARFNPDSTNEERRAFQNLFLMCHEHHTETHDETIYPVTRMKQIKEKHELKFSRIIDDITLDQVYDEPRSTVFVQPKNLDFISNILALDKEDALAVNQALPHIVSALRELPLETRKIFTLFVERTNGEKIAATSFSFSRSVRGVSRSKVISHMQVLEELGLLHNDLDDNLTSNSWVLSGPKTTARWPVIAILRDFAALQRIELSTFLVAFDFSSLSTDTDKG